MPNQVSVDVAIIPSQNAARERIGLNLLDGLRLQYGVARGATRTSDRAGSYHRAIPVPQLNHKLNIFNRGGQMYSVVARPQLTAYGRTERVLYRAIAEGRGERGEQQSRARCSAIC